MALFNTPKVRRFVRHIKNQGSVTKKTQKFYNGMGYYMMIWHLRDQGIVEEDGTNNSNEKLWVLTNKGKKVCAKFDELEILEKELEELVKR